LEENRRYIGVELNSYYADISRMRLQDTVEDLIHQT